MNVFVARSTAIEMSQLDGHSQTLRKLLGDAGHRVEILNLPPIAAVGRTLTNLASYRLIDNTTSADVLICLDAVSAVLPHPRKLVLLLDDSHLDPRVQGRINESMPDRNYVANVLRQSLGEAKDIFVLSSFAAIKLGELSVKQPHVLSPYVPGGSFSYSREPSSELLVLNPLTGRHRPELLVDCLAALPEPFRARWIAPEASPSDVSRLNALALKAGVDQRLSVDVRHINEGEKAYVIAKAAALLELASDCLAPGYDVYQALQAGLPVIACSDGGALAEVASLQSLRSVEPDGASLARAVVGALTCSPNDLLPSPAQLSSANAATAWSALMEAVAQ